MLHNHAPFDHAALQPQVDGREAEALQEMHLLGSLNSMAVGA